MVEQSKIIKKSDVDKKVDLATRLELGDESRPILDSQQRVVGGKAVESIREGNEIIQRAVVESKEIKEKAKEIYLQIGAKMEEARQQGFEKGRQEGLASVTGLLAQTKKENIDMLGRIEKEAVSLVYEVASKIIGETLRVSDEALFEMIHKALQSAMGNELILFVNPADYERIKTHESQLVSALQAVQTLQIKASEHVRAQGCVIESELGTIDAQLDFQLEAIKKALGLT